MINVEKFVKFLFNILFFIYKKKGKKDGIRL